jgi:hypothetical protein
MCEDTKDASDYDLKSSLQEDRAILYISALPARLRRDRQLVPWGPGQGAKDEVEATSALATSLTVTVRWLRCGREQGNSPQVSKLLNR